MESCPVVYGCEKRVQRSEPKLDMVEIKIGGTSAEKLLKLNNGGDSFAVLV